MLPYEMHPSAGIASVGPEPFNPHPMNLLSHLPHPPMAPNGFVTSFYQPAPAATVSSGPFEDEGKMNKGHWMNRRKRRADEVGFRSTAPMSTAEDDDDCAMGVGGSGDSPTVADSSDEAPSNGVHVAPASSYGFHPQAKIRTDSGEGREGNDGLTLPPEPTAVPVVKPGPV